jgi:putative oxidoreductase
VTTNLQHVVALIGRIALAAVFIFEGIHKLTSLDATAAYMARGGLPMVTVLLALSILVELGGGLAIAVGWKARWAAAAIAVFIVPVTLVFHVPFVTDAQAGAMQTMQSLKNLSIFGGMLLLVAFGPGRYSLDRRA